MADMTLDIEIKEKIIVGDRLSLSGGHADLTLPRKLSADDVDDVEQWFALIVRRLKRHLGAQTVAEFIELAEAAANAADGPGEA